MNSKILQYFIIFLTALVLDGVWLGVISKSFYKKHIGFLMTDTPNLKVALLFYIVFALGVLVLITLPALSQNFSVGKVALYGAILGLVAYGAYDFTNQAIVKGWPTVITIVDLLWGVVMTALTASISYLIIKALR